MESFESFDGDISTQNERTPEVRESSPEANEKAKKSSQKTLAQIARSRKDEGRAQAQDLLLVQVIQILLQKDSQPQILTLLLDIVKEGISPHVAIAWISLISKDARLLLLQAYHLADTFPIVAFRTDTIKFSESNILPNERIFINSWITLIFEVLSINPSTVRTQSLSKLLISDNRQNIENIVNQILSIFFLGINITPTKALAGYAKFIISEVGHRLSSLPLEDLENGGKIQ